MKLRIISSVVFYASASCDRALDMIFSSLQTPPSFFFYTLDHADQDSGGIQFSKTTSSLATLNNTRREIKIFREISLVLVRIAKLLIYSAILS